MTTLTRRVLETVPAYQAGYDRAINLSLSDARALQSSTDSDDFDTFVDYRAFLLGAQDAADELREGACDGAAAARTTDWDYGSE